MKKRLRVIKKQVVADEPLNSVFEASTGESAPHFMEHPVFRKQVAEKIRYTVTGARRIEWRRRITLFQALLCLLIPLSAYIESFDFFRVGATQLPYFYPILLFIINYFFPLAFIVLLIRSVTSNVRVYRFAIWIFSLELLKQLFRLTYQTLTDIWISLFTIVILLLLTVLSVMLLRGLQNRYVVEEEQCNGVSRKRFNFQTKPC